MQKAPHAGPFWCRVLPYFSDDGQAAMPPRRQLRPQWTVAGVRALQGTPAPALAAGQSRYVEGLAAAGLPPG